MKQLFIFSVLLVVTGLAQAQDTGKVCLTGKAVTPSVEGNILRLYPSSSKQDAPCVQLVKEKGEMVIVLTQEGHFISPQEAWNTFQIQDSLKPKTPTSKR